MNMTTDESFLDKIRKVIVILLPIPFVLGTAGYYISGQTLGDSIYYGIGLYGFSWENSSKNIYIEIARWTAPLLTVAGLAAVVKSVCVFLRNGFIGFFCKDATCIYSDSARGGILNNNTEHSILCEKKPLKHVKNHILLFDSDEKNILFYQKYKSFFQNVKAQREVCLCLNELDADMLKSEMDNVRIFNGKDIIARALWKSVKIWNCTEKQKTHKIAILGFDGLGQRILRFGLQMNLYSVQQCVEYHVFGNSELYEASHHYFRTLNQDAIVFHGGDCDGKWDILEEADYIIVSQGSTIELLQSLCKRCERSNIYYYSPNGGDWTEYIKRDRLFAFGKDCDVYSNEHIRTDKLYEAAKKLHYSYLNPSTDRNGQPDTQFAKEMEAEWKKLDGFTKGSNISAGDYQDVIRELNTGNAGKDGDGQLEEYAELEHIRWCRYHFLNGWRYGVPETGKAKDVERKIHKCLCPYSELPDGEKEKDRNVIKRILGLC